MDGGRVVRKGRVRERDGISRADQRLVRDDADGGTGIRDPPAYNRGDRARHAPRSSRPSPPCTRNIAT